MAKTVMKSFRLHEQIARELQVMAKREGISESGIITILIHAQYEGFTQDDIEQMIEQKKLT